VLQRHLPDIHLANLLQSYRRAAERVDARRPVEAAVAVRPTVVRSAAERPVPR
jgi:hypothetical protein